MRLCRFYDILYLRGDFMRNEYIIDWPLLKKWTNESHHSGIRLALFIVWCILLVGSLVFAILSIVANMYTNAFYSRTVAVNQNC